MRKLIFAAAAVCAGQIAVAQTPETPSEEQEVVNCFTGAQMGGLFKSGQIKTLEGFKEGVGARVQRQFPNTRISGQAKHIRQADGRTLGICEYSSHIGNVGVFTLGSAQADAYDEACDNGTCEDGGYWRSDWREPDAAQDRPGQEMIKACYRDVDGMAFPSSRCGFTFPAK